MNTTLPYRQQIILAMQFRASLPLTVARVWWFLLMNMTRQLVTVLKIFQKLRLCAIDFLLSIHRWRTALAISVFFLWRVSPSLPRCRSFRGLTTLWIFRWMRIMPRCSAIQRKSLGRISRSIFALMPRRWVCRMMSIVPKWSGGITALGFRLIAKLRFTTLFQLHLLFTRNNAHSQPLGHLLAVPQCWWIFWSVRTCCRLIPRRFAVYLRKNLT